MVCRLSHLSVGVSVCVSVRWVNDFGRDFGASHCKQCGLCGVVVRKCVDRSSCHLRVSGVDPGIGVLDGGPGARRDREGFRFFSSLL